MEDDIFRIFQGVIREGKEADSLWKEERFIRITSWSCESARIFCIVTSMMNSWFLRIVKSALQYKPALSVVNTFICKVKQRCSQYNKDFVFLYPKEYHSLICLLDINPEVFSRSVLTSVLDIVRASMDKHPIQTRCLLTHFSQWITILVSWNDYMLINWLDTFSQLKR